MKKLLIFGFLILLLMPVTHSQEEKIYYLRQNRLDFGHIIVIEEIRTEPSMLVPGKPGLLKMSIVNNGNQFVDDLRIELSLPEEIGFLDDVSKRKIFKLESGGESEIGFNIITLPNTEEGIYDASLTIDYVNHIGDERQDIYNLSIVVKSAPRMFAHVEASEIYIGKYTGDITIKFVNNDLSDIKFLTAELLESKDYEIISSSKEYIGDLDSDDFESVDFRISIKKKDGEIVLPLKVDYKDILNNYFSEEKEVVLKLRSAEDLGVGRDNTLLYILGVVVILLLMYYFYAKYRKRLSKLKRY
jgi:hypothetical protein